MTKALLFWGQISKLDGPSYSLSCVYVLALTVSYRDDINLFCWTPPSSPQARHCNRGLYTSKLMLMSVTLSILWECFLLYLLTPLSSPLRSAQAAIFPFCLSDRKRTQTGMLPSRNVHKVAVTRVWPLNSAFRIFFYYYFAYWGSYKLLMLIHWRKTGWLIWINATMHKLVRQEFPVNERTMNAPTMLTCNVTNKIRGDKNGISDIINKT